MPMFVYISRSKTNMANAEANSNFGDIERCLNALSSLDMRGIASDNDLREVANDYFVPRPIGDDESDDSVSVSDSDDDSLRLRLSVSDSSSDSGDDVSDAIADVVMPRGHGQERDADTPLTCKCKLNEGQPCHTRYEDGVLADVRMQFLGMSHDELDIAILAKLSCGMHLSSVTTKSRRKHQQARTAQRTDFYHHGFRICRDLFKAIHGGISQDKLTALIAHYTVAGVEARVHGNKRRRPANALKFHDTRAVVDFIVNYAEANAILLPGRTPHHWKYDVKLLPTNCTKTKVYQLYCVATYAAGTRKVSLRTFQRLWQQLLPFIATMRPATDLCWYCQKGATKLARSSNLTESEKSAALRDYDEHLKRATMERTHYTTVCKAVKAALPDDLALGPHTACSFAEKAHYSFDFAQQVHFPSDPLQPGPIYFKCTRKCGLFGVACEAFPRQVNYMLDESVHTGKGANCVISMLHHFFEHYAIGECHVHADNCSGQNKNSAMMQYLMSRVLTGRHKSITLSFLLTGHTKFSCDWCFGLVKRLYRKTRVDCLDDIAAVIHDSSTVNIAQSCGTESGDVIVPSYDWAAFLSTHFRKVVAIKKLHHFHFVEGSGSVRVQQFIDSESAEQLLLRRALVGAAVNVMPAIIQPRGLDAKRQWYLYQEIRPFTAPHCQEITTPLPAVPKRAQVDDTPADSDSDDEDLPPPPPTKSARGRGRAHQVV